MWYYDIIILHSSNFIKRFIDQKVQHGLCLHIKQINKNDNQDTRKVFEIIKLLIEAYQVFS